MQSGTAYMITPRLTVDFLRKSRGFSTRCSPSTLHGGNIFFHGRIGAELESQG